MGKCFNIVNQAKTLSNFASYRINVFRSVHILVDCNTEIPVAVNHFKTIAINLHGNFNVFQLP